MELSKRELLKRVGILSQVAGVREVELRSGRAKGTKALEAYNPAGLRFTVLPDKCMDLAEMSYRGINLGFLSKNGLTSNSFFNALDNEFLYNWSGGLLSTCGLANTGEACTDQGLYRTEHGRIGSMPAEGLSVREIWNGDDCVFKLSGSMRESRIYGSNLMLHREIECGIFDRKITIVDTLENLEPSPEEFMILYHINFGYPLVDEGSEVVRSEARTYARTEMTDEDLAAWGRMEAPLDGHPEQVFYHVNPSVYPIAQAAILNRRLKLGVAVAYSADTLPILVHWKSRRSHDYTVALEPSNTYIMGRSKEREHGTLPRILGYESIRFKLELAVLDGDSAIDSFIASLR